jgi:hypothetical protein
MALPSDIIFYIHAQEQALLFSVAGIFGLVTWLKSLPFCFLTSQPLTLKSF